MIAFALMFLKWLPGGLLSPILSHLEKQASTEAARQAEIVRAEMARRELQRDILAAEQGWWFTAMIRPLLALPVVIWLWKVIVWDKVLGWGVTDPLTGQVGEWAAIIVGAYMLGETVERTAKIVKRPTKPK